MSTKGKITMTVMAAILLACLIAFWGSVFGGICLLALGYIPICLIRRWYSRQSDPLDYSQSPENEDPQKYG